MGASALLRRPGLLRTLWLDARLAVRLLREPRVSFWAKTTLPLALLYLISPLDLLPDFVIGIGEIDDLLVLYGAMKLFLVLCPRQAVSFHRDALNAGRPFAPMSAVDTVIDAEFRRE